jgi:transcription-repair coupling factor (superfamily II helicase)
VIAAQQHASRLVVPSSQRFGAKRWPSHKDHAAKALQKLAGPHLPATLKQLEKAIAQASTELHRAQEQASTKNCKRIAADRKATAPGADVCAVDEADGQAESCDELADDLVDGQVEDEDLLDVGAELEPGGEFCSDAESGL